MVPARAPCVDGPCDELLADAALALDEHRRLEVGDLRDRSEDLRHRGALREDRLELALLLDLLLQRAVLAPERLALLRLPEREHDLVGLERLADVVVGAGLHRLEREVDAAVRAHHDHGRRVLLRLQRREQIETVHLGHPDVGEDDVRAERVHERERRFAAVGDLHVVAMALEKRLQDEADVLFIVDDKDPAHLCVRKSCEAEHTTIQAFANADELTSQFFPSAHPFAFGSRSSVWPSPCFDAWDAMGPRPREP